MPKGLSSCIFIWLFKKLFEVFESLLKRFTLVFFLCNNNLKNYYLDTSFIILVYSKFILEKLKIGNGNVINEIIAILSF